MPRAGCRRSPCPSGAWCARRVFTGDSRILRILSRIHSCGLKKLTPEMFQQNSVCVFCVLCVCVRFDRKQLDFGTIRNRRRLRSVVSTLARYLYK